MTIMRGLQSLVEWKPPRKAHASNFTEASLPPWEYFVLKSGAEGEAWVEGFDESCCLEARLEIERALDLLRERRFEDAWSVLSTVGRTMRRVDEEHPDWAGIIGRWYHSASAYGHFLLGDYPLAWSEVGKAQATVDKVVQHSPILLPFGYFAVEIGFLMGRIARAECRWQTVRELYDEALELAAGRTPLCRDGAGQDVLLQTIDEYIFELPLLTPEELAFLIEVIDHRKRELHLGTIARSIYKLNTILIPYP